MMYEPMMIAASIILVIIQEMELILYLWR